VRDGRPGQRDGDQPLLGGLDRLGDGHRDLAGLPLAHADLALLVAPAARAEKLRFLPPLTTFVTRRMEIT
jgi:hypothetical protein